MAIGVMTWVWNHSQSRHGSRLVLLAIADSMGSEHGWAWPSVAELARKTALKERGVQTAIADLVKLGELEVAYNAGPKGCNRYRVLLSTPAESAPPQNLHPVDNAPPQTLQGRESSQVNGQTPAESAPPAENAGVQNPARPPAESAPGTVREPKDKNSPTESSTAQNSLLSDDEIPGTATKPKRGRRPKPGPDPLFDEWYSAYPVHKSRGAAEDAWMKVRRDGVDPQALITAAKRYTVSDDVRRGYGKHPATWLNQKCWLDEDTPPREASESPRNSPPQPRKVNYTDEEYNSGW